MCGLGVARDTTIVAYGDRHNSYATATLWTVDFYQHVASSTSSKADASAGSPMDAL